MSSDVNDDDDSTRTGSSSTDDETPSLCTFAATGSNPTFQAIFVCLDCSSNADEEGAACICHACAEQCHAGHDVDYIAMGPAYCDCHTKIGGTCCRLQEASEKEAKRISVPSEGMKEHYFPSNEEEGTFVQEAFTIASLENDDRACDRLIREATELIKHTRDTHWLDLNNTKPDNDEKYSKLEDLALTILRRHVKAYQLRNNDDNTGEFHGGAEWWVQVKPVTLPTGGDESRLDHIAEGEEAVDLHFDKDEALAESFDLGSFPTLSTVTYLTATPNASPTIVFPHTYNKDEGEVMEAMLVSYPKRGKHLVFDGRLLHGAPAHHALRQIQEDESNDGKSDSALNRVTFLVNVWVDRQPSGVKVLPSETRQLVRAAGKRKKLPSILQQQKTTIIEFESRPIETVCLEKDDDLPESIRGRIELPFVSKGATWISNVGGNGLVLVTFPPPPTGKDTVQVKFGPGLQAYLEYQSPDDGEKERVNMGEQVDYV